jgi:NET1-associated nuclear protein 1 (U3 small nucleolar RNA-associated protein 17)
VSGGSETTLELWQLDTGKRQNLPHLTSAIEAITVSPTGTSYGIRLSDNSVIVLSTAELAPKAVVAGLQSRVKGPYTRFAKTPAVSNRLNHDQIFLAVPAPQHVASDKASFSHAPFMQTYDLNVGRHVSRQAFARNNVTNFNIGPGAMRIRESNITLMQASADGKWLATVEEWTPPILDVKFLVSNPEDEDVERFQRRETYIKFWLWDEVKDQWTLEARIDSPHQSITVASANRILDLAADPQSTGFASVGQDGILRTWKPKTRLRDGTIVHGVRDGGLIIWLCSQSINIEKTVRTAHADQDIQFCGIPQVAKLAFSNDASVLAVSQDGLEVPNAGIVHFIDIHSGVVKSTQSLMYSSGLTGMQFLGQYLVVLSDDIRVWDVVMSSWIFGHDLQLPDLLDVEIRSTSHLAVDISGDKFAIAHAILKDEPSATVCTRILVFEPSAPEPLLKVDLATAVTALIPLHGSPGFAVIDAAAQIQMIKPSTAATIDIGRIGLMADAQADVSEDPVVEAPVIDVAEAELEAVEDVKVDGSEDEEDDEDSDKPVVRPEQLAAIFDVGPSFALPSVYELFHAVAGLYAQKPLGREATVPGRF